MRKIMVAALVAATAAWGRADESVDMQSAYRALELNVQKQAALTEARINSAPARSAVPAYLDLSGGGWPGPIVVVGDTQHTLAWEKLIGRESNNAETVRLLAAAAGEAPGLVVHLGDLVSWGADASKWADFDREMAPLRAAGVPVLPAVGNHDYMGGRSEAMANIEGRFPQLRASHWYSRRLGGLGLVWLDSNDDQLGAAAWKAQRAWFQQALGQMDGDPSVRGILVFEHHPPYSNSAVTGDDETVQRDLLPAFYSSAKTLAMITGHAHTYEHFVIQGKTFIVSGGGGGPRVDLLSGAAQRHQDLYSSPAPRPFHYLLLNLTDRGVDVLVKGFQKSANAADEIPRPIDHFTLDFPR